MQKSKHNISYIFTICAIASLGGFILGYDASVISGAIEPLTEFFELTPFESGWAVSNVIFGCIIGAYSGGYIADRLGRKKTLIVATIIFAISAIGSALATNFTWFIIYRMLGGLGIGVASIVTPLYTAEVSPKDYRGRMLGMQQLFMVGGQLIVYIVNFFIAWGMAHIWLVEFGWRWMLASEIVPCIAFFLTVALIPESPRWCAMHKRDKQALGILSKISNAEHAQKVLKEIQESISSDSLQKQEGMTSKIIGDPRARYILWIGCAIAIFQQLTGINILLYYAPSLLKNVAANSEESLFQTIFLGLALFIGVAAALKFIDKTGRVPLMRFGSMGCFICLLFSSWLFYRGTMGYLPIISLVIFVFVYGISWSLGAWLLISEIFPNRMRAVAMGFAFTAMYISNFIVAQTFPMINRHPILMEYFNGSLPLIICAVCCLISYWFIGRFLPETKGVSLEQIEPIMLSKSHRFGASTLANDMNKQSAKENQTVN